ncbi:MAG: hypothetical protein JXM70_24065, partial [Pirellulales bacterium]|nr:hypothetical protein [Pirellulales bacterium]
GYCLANPGKEYLVYLPEGGKVTVDLSAASGTLRQEWISPITGAVTSIGNAVGGGHRTFKAPFEKEAVLYINATPAQGPLRVHPENSRYFTDGTKMPDGSLKAVYLTGSHTWNNLQDPDPATAPPFDYEGYLDFLQSYNHNFFRMWTRMGTGGGPTPTPTIYPRTGPGKAKDGGLKYDLNRFNQEFFDRLRARVKAAGERGIYVAVMFFAGDNVEYRDGNRNWPQHPYHRDNNINGINGDPDGDGQGLECYRLEIAAITLVQDEYVKKVIDTLNDLDNVLWEVGNELPGTIEFQLHVTRLVKEYETSHNLKHHPVGISTFANARPPMRVFQDGPADWITPDTSSGDYTGDPPSADGKKVIVSDTDHLWGVGGDNTWVWKSFARGHHPIYMDPLSATENVSEAQLEGARKAMGQTRRFAERIESTQKEQPRPRHRADGEQPVLIPRVKVGDDGEPAPQQRDEPNVEYIAFHFFAPILNNLLSQV